MKKLLAAGLIVELLAFGCTHCHGHSVPDLRVGVISDVHVPVSGIEKMRQACALFDRRKVDAVLVCGDLTQYGLVRELEQFRDVWRSAFPGNRRSDGGEVIPLFIYGDHDTGGYMHKFHDGEPPCQLHGIDKATVEKELIVNVGSGKVWHEVFGEDWDFVQVKTVKGYRFILAHYYGTIHQDTPPGLAQRFAEATAGLDAKRPFFFVQHRVFPGTVDAFPWEREWWCADGAVSKDLLANHHNAIALCGHAHSNLLNEGNFWQGGFTAVEVPSLHELGLPRATGDRKTKDNESVQCLIMNVWPDRVAFERLDARQDGPIAPDWSVDLPLRAFSTLRLPATRENWPAQRAMLSRSRDCFDEIWFSACNFKSLAENAEKAKWLGEVAREVREMGYVASLEFELTIGNTDTPDCKRLPFKDWMGFTGPEGWEGVNCNCPRDPRFHAYFREQLKYYGAWAPTVIWLDDDVRVDNHGNNSTGCFCARCLAAFSKVEGRTWTREALVAAMKKDAALAARWREHCFRGLGEFAYAFCRAAKEFSPTSRLGLQYPWADEGQLHIVEAMVKAAGEPIEMRPGCCSYCDRDPFAQIDKTYRMQCQVKTLLAHPDWYSRLCPEIETYPRTFTTRTARSLGFEALTHLASGLDSLTWYIAGNAEQPELYEGTTFRAPRENMALYREYVRRNAGAEQIGFGAPEGETFGKDMKGFAAVNGSSTIPYAFGAGRKLGTVLWREDQVADADEAALKKMLSGAVLATRAAASALVARGLVPSDAAKLPSEKYTDSTAYFPKSVKTAEGGQLVVYPSLDPMGATVKTLLEYAHLADMACGGRFPVLFEDPALAVVLPRVFANGSFASAVIVNTRIEEQAPVRLRLRGFGSDEALWYPLWSGSTVRLPVVREAKTGDALVTLPAVGAWSGGFLVPETTNFARR